jgi:hypothetical protein
MFNALSLLALPLLARAAPAPATTPSSFQPLNTIYGNATVINSCTYDLYVQAVGGGDTNLEMPDSLPAKYMWHKPLRTTPNGGGVSIKVSKTPDMSNIMQFEYALANGLVYYDISLLNCLGTGANSHDASDCPGWKDGLLGVGGRSCGDAGRVECRPGEICENMNGAYWSPEANYTNQAPVKACNEHEGVSFELCARLKTTII